MGRPAIFLDRDGVLNENRADYVRSWEQFVFLPGTFSALRRLAILDVPIIVITNQAGVGRRLISRQRIDEIHASMVEEIRRAGVRIDGIFWCPHTSNDQCSCRKPEPGMLLGAAEQFDIDLQQSVFIGDAVTDIEAGRRAGCQTVLVMTGRGRNAVASIHRDNRATIIPDAIATDLSAAVPVVKQMLSSMAPHRTWLQHLQPASLSDELVSPRMQLVEG